MNIFKLYVNFQEGSKDYVTASVFRDDILYKKLEDISKPYDINNYTTDWKNGLINHYYKLAQEQIGNDKILVTI